MELSRRELCAAFLGAAAASAGCEERGGRAQVPGALVDRAVDTGHLLRGAPLPLPAGPPRPVEVLVVGGGVAGLSAAWRLCGAGVKDLLVVDVDLRMGGTSQSGKNAVSAYPWGAHYLPAPLEDRGPVPRLLREVGAITGVDDGGAAVYAEQMLLRQPEERIFYRGSWYEGLYLRAGASAEDLAQLQRFEARIRALSALRDAKGRKAYDVPIEAGSDDAELLADDRLSMAQWLAKEGFDSPRLQWLVDYACRDDFGARSRDVSAYAGLWYFCSRRDGDRHNAGYLSWPEGNGRLVAQLARPLRPGQAQAGILIHTLKPEGDHCLAYGVDAKTRAPVLFRARQVIVACPRFVARHLLAPWRKEAPAFHDAFHYSPWVVANLTVRRPPKSRGFPLCWDNVPYESRSLGYVVATHQREVADESGPTVLTWYYPLDGADPKKERERLLSAGYGEWEEVVMADLRGPHRDIDRLATRLEVMRWGHAMIRPVPGFLGSDARAKARAPVGGAVHFAHSDLGGMALFEEANWHGVRAAEDALAGLGRPAPSWL